MGMTATERLRALLDERGVEYELTFLGSKELFNQYDWSTDEA